MNLKVNSTFLVIASVVSFSIIAAVGKNGRMKWPLDIPAESKISEDATAVKKIAVPAFSMEAAIDTPPDDPNEIDLTYPIYDRVTDFLTTPNANSFDLQDPASIQKNIEYDPDTKQYILTETIGNQFYRNPTYMTFEEYLDYQAKNSEQQYWLDRKMPSSISGMRSRKHSMPS